MRRLLLCALVLALLPGCKKGLDKLSEDTKVKPNEKFKSTQHWLTDQKGPGDQPAVHAPTGVVLNPGGGGGSGGAAQAVRKAATRTVNYNELENIRLFISTAEVSSGRMPSKQAVEQALMREAPKTYELVKENVIILTGTRSRENIWAYTYDPQTAAGEHLVIRSGNIEKVPGQELARALQQQQGH
jgi:hypothetical protein